MARLVLCVLALLGAGVLADPMRKMAPQKVVDPVFLQRQLDLMELYYHVHEPSHVEEWKNIAQTWSLEKNIDHYTNVTAVKTLIEMLEHKWHLPRAVPFAVLEPEHQFEAVTIFNVLHTAKDYDTFYKTAVYLRDRVNEHLFIYVLSVAILNRPDTQGIFIPHIYEVFPSFFNNGEVMTTAQRINTHGSNMIDFYPTTYKWDDNVVIKRNYTMWPYISENMLVAYFTHDYGLNSFYYNLHLTQPGWLGEEIVPLVKDRRGEWFWFVHKQILARYYMERLSNGLGEIPELGHEIVKEGYSSGLLYHNGIPFPVRPNYYHLDQPVLIDELQQIEDFERRVRDAIDQGYVVNHLGEHISLSNPEAIDVLGRVIEASVDSPNVHFYKDFISVWKKVLGNSQIHEHQFFHHSNVPLVVPSVLEHYQTTLRDHAFYMIWKRVLGLFKLWQQKLPFYKREELALPQVAIQKVEVDKLVTYFENTYMNVTSHLHMDEQEQKQLCDHVSVLVQHPRLNHKTFQVRVHVKSEVAKTVVVRFFLAPKYDSHGVEIPLHLNTENFFMLDEFIYDLPTGECTITRDSVDNYWTAKDYSSAHQWYDKVEKALHNKEQFVVDQSEGMERLPHRLQLPKGRVGGMPFVLMVYISEYRAPAVAYGTGFDPAISLGFGTGARHLTDDPLGFPLNRPLYNWQVDGLHNVWFEDVLIHHKHTPEIVVPHKE